MRTLLSEQFKRSVLAGPRSRSELATLVHLNITQLSWFLHDRVSIGPVNRAKLVHLGSLLGLSESQCFKKVEVGRG